MSNELKDWLRDTLVEELQARIAELEKVAEAALCVYNAGFCEGTLEEPLAAAGYLGGGE